jgi:hypothetical protein
MNIRSNLLAIVSVAAIAGLASTASAEPAKNACKPESTAITSSTIVYAGWYVSGTCLEMVTNATLANDDGKGFQELSFTFVKNPDNADARVSLLIPSVSRAGPGEVGIPLGQYLLQLKNCPNGKASEKCRVLDEKYLIVPMGAVNPS